MNNLATATIYQAIHKVKDLGFRVFIPNNKKPITYFHYSDGQNVAFIQTNDIFHDSIKISTVHKPSTWHGTGFAIHGEDSSVDVENLTVPILAHGFITIPSWAIKTTHMPEKYTLETWLANNWSGQRSIEL
jgi:hypothetical protein